MSEFLRFAFLGLGTGAVYSLVGHGVVLVYRGSGIINFAHGALAMVGAFVHWDLHHEQGWPLLPSIVVAVTAVAVLGAAIHLVVMRPLVHSAPLIRVIVTLGIITTLTAGAELYWGGDQRLVDSPMPVEAVTFGSVTIPSDRLYLMAIAVVLTIVLWAGYRFTKFGLAVTAAAEDERAAAALGWSPDLLATVNWALGGALAAIAGILVVPLTGLQVDTLTLIVIAAMAAALLGSFSSFWLTLLGGVAVGIAQSLTVRYVDTPGAADAIPFLMIIAVLVVRGRALPLRSHVLDQMPKLGPTRVSPYLFAVPVALAGLALTVLPDSWNYALIVSTVTAIIMLSVVILTGFAGQISLAQVALAGLGALVAGRLVESGDVPFELAIVAGAAASLVIGLVFALPALRTRGLNLAVVTLGMGLAVQTVIFGNTDYTGGATGTSVGRASFFGVDIDRLSHPGRYAAFCLLGLALAVVLTANVRRGRAGRRLIAVRTNERAAASLGIGVFGAKLFAYAISALLAGLGGTLLAFQDQVIVYTRFSPLESINVVLLAVLGGVGFVTGALAGSVITVGGIAAIVTNEIGVDENWIVLAGGIILIVQLVTVPDGLASVPHGLIERFRGSRKAADRTAPEADDFADVATTYPVTATTLHVDSITVRLGGIYPVRDLGFEVSTGEAVGLIGPNGAGKTTFIDAVTGFVSLASGAVRVGDVDVTGWSAARRARHGLSRTFQSLELFEDLTVRDNLLAGADRHGLAPYFADPLLPRTDELPAAARRAVRDLDLVDVLDKPISELAYGRRRLVSIARALAATPPILLLDEPAAGLSDTETAELRHLIRTLVDEWGMGVLLVEHDMRLVMSACDRVVAIDAGRKIAEGTPEEISRDGHVRASYLGADDPDATAPGATAPEPIAIATGAAPAAPAEPNHQHPGVDIK